MKRSTAFTLSAWMSLALAAGDPKPFTTGEIRLRVVSGPQETELRYRLNDDRMRIDRPGEIIPAPPVNLIELATGTLTILHPHNGTMEKIPAASLRPATAGIAGLPLPPPSIGPQQLPEMPRLPERPSLPVIPSAPPPAPGGVTSPPVVPRVPAVMPPMFPGQAPPLELKDTAERREIHGYPCTRYTLTIPREGEMTLWLAGPGLFPPFHLLAEDKPNPTPRRDEFARIPALLREKDLFPLLAELKGEDDRIMLRWEVTGIAAGPVDDDSLFQVPASFQGLDSP